jgi:hypothetical protein
MLSRVFYNAFWADDEEDRDLLEATAEETIFDLVAGEPSVIGRDEYDSYGSDRRGDPHCSFSLEFPDAKIIVDTPQIHLWRQDGVYETQAGAWTVKFSLGAESRDLEILIRCM